MATPHRRSSSSSSSAIITGVAALVACAAAGGRPHQPFPHAPPPPPGTCQWCGHCCGATEQVVPPWPPTYVMSASTVLMPCNGTGLIDPSSPTAGDFSKWAFASIDWSNGKDGPTVSPASQPASPASLSRPAWVLTCFHPAGADRPNAGPPRICCYRAGRKGGRWTQRAAWWSRQRGSWLQTPPRKSEYTATSSLRSPGSRRSPPNYAIQNIAAGSFHLRTTTRRRWRRAATAQTRHRRSSAPISFTATSRCAPLLLFPGAFRPALTFGSFALQVPRWPPEECTDPSCSSGAKNAFLACHFILKTIILPSQALDKHGRAE